MIKVKLYVFEINFIPRPVSPNECPEWAIVDLQGSLETRQPVPLGGKFVGDLHFTKQVQINCEAQKATIVNYYRTVQCCIINDNKLEFKSSTTVKNIFFSQIKTCNVVSAL